jgi:hypothetical protein
MRNRSLFFFLPVISLLLMNSCRLTRMTVDVLVPPEVKLPATIKSVGVINRAAGNKEQDVDSLFKNVVSGEGDYSIYLGAQRSLFGAIDYLEYSEEFDRLVPVKINFPGVIYTQKPAPMSWEFIDQICENNQLDALVSIESFHSENEVSVEEYDQKKQEQKNKVWTNRILYNMEVTKRYVSSLKVRLHSCWRFYLPEERRIVDEYEFVDSVLWEMDGYTSKEAEEKLPNRSLAVEDGGYFIGEQYASRIVPGWKTVQRDFYAPKTRKFRGTSKNLKMRRWGVLMDKWEELIKDPDPEIEGMAYHNLAVIMEMKGDYAQAMENLEVAIKCIHYPPTMKYEKTLQSRQQEFEKDE